MDSVKILDPEPWLIVAFAHWLQHPHVVSRLTDLMSKPVAGQRHILEVADALIAFSYKQGT